ncbi:tissue factor pathway inhibitor-like isoform X2 [Dermacentor albipictus]|uniref:tissue factor pathway inhibitor-like isoform X2 n=1 Tax=Dermacentor albipictus TaxID=60249 RepID=UPI0031FD9AD9
MWFQQFTFLTYCIFYFIPREGEAVSPHVRCSSMPTEDDECQSPIHKWYYNRNKGECENFMYGDCPRDENMFDSKEECKKNCMTKGLQKKEEGGSPSKGSKRRKRPSKTEGSSEETMGGGAKGWRPDGSGEQETATGSAPVKRPGGGRAPGKFGGLSGGYNTRPKRRPTPYRPRPVRRRTPQPLPPKATLGSGHCGARPRKGNCEGSNDKWYYNGAFYTCSRVREGMCPTVGTFFESCGACFDKCRMGRNNNCDYQK